MRIASFNLQNLRLRDGRLDGARDSDDPRDMGPEAARLDPVDRRLTAEVLALIDADLVALQEVFDRPTLDRFHDNLLLPLGVAPYPWRICLPGNDGRGLDLAVLSRRPVLHSRSHAALTPRDLGLAADRPDAPLFRRDALRVDLAGLTLWVVHFKAPRPDPSGAARVRRLEAEALARLIAAAHGSEDLWLIAGDFNDPDPDAADSAVALLIRAGMVDLSARGSPADLWTTRDPATGRRAAPARILAAPALARRWPAAVPVPVRLGLDRSAGGADDPRLAQVGPHRPHASDHAALMLDLPGL